MKNKNKFARKFAAGALSVAVLAGANSAFAAGWGENGASHDDGIISALVAKFGLAKADVQSVFTSYHDSEKSKMETNRANDEKERLAGAVSVGNLTQAQVDLITAKQADVKMKMDALMQNTSLNQADRRTQMKAIMDDMNSWIKSNNIPEKYVRGMSHGPMMKGGHGERGGRGHGFGR